MRNTLILIGQIHQNEADGLDPFHAVVEATVQRSRPVLLTALAAIFAFIPLTQSVFWGNAGLHADWQDDSGHGADPCFPACHVLNLVQDPP